MAAAERASVDVEKILGRQTMGMLIDGQWVQAASGESFETINPATGAVLARVPSGDAEDVDRAVRAARRAFDGGWSTSKPAERQAIGSGRESSW